MTAKIKNNVKTYVIPLVAMSVAALGSFFYTKYQVDENMKELLEAKENFKTINKDITELKEFKSHSEPFLMSFVDTRKNLLIDVVKIKTNLASLRSSVSTTEHVRKNYVNKETYNNGMKNLKDNLEINKKLDKIMEMMK